MCVHIHIHILELAQYKYSINMKNHYCYYFLNTTENAAPAC